MNIKPILFNTDMVRALLNERKTATRRVVKPQFALDADGKKHAFGGVEGNMFICADKPNIKMVIHPPHSPGDILYVRETWCLNNFGWHYRADWPRDNCLDMGADDKWHPSIHMPKEAARLFLRVMDVRVERLLTPFFAPGAAIMELRKEGITLPGDCAECIENYGNPCCIDAEEDSECGILDEVRGEFSDLWDSTIKPANRPIYGWAANPWVWVIEFERISKEATLEGAHQ